MQKSRSSLAPASVHPNDRHVIVAEYRTDQLANPLVAAARFQAIGYFPRSSGHLRQRPHGAAEWVIIIVVAGSGWSEIDGHRQHHGPNSVITLAPNQAHAYGADEQDPWTIAWAHISGDAVNMQHPLTRLSAKQLLRVTELIDEAHAVLHDLRHGDDLFLASAIAAHLLGLLGRPHEADDNLARLLQDLRADLSLKIDLPTMAARAGLSVSQFLLRFRALTHTTPMDWLSGERIALACRLLARSDHDIPAIALQSGFANSNTFTRAFRQRMGLSPSAYRRAGPPG